MKNVFRYHGFPTRSRSDKKITFDDRLAAFFKWRFNHGHLGCPGISWLHVLQTPILLESFVLQKDILSQPFKLENEHETVTETVHEKHKPLPFE